MALTKTQCDKLKPKEKAFKKFDGEGLYLEVRPNGSKLWRLKYYYQGKEKRLSLGKYPVITLVEARKKKMDAKDLLDQDIDPSVDRRIKSEQNFIQSKGTFKHVAEEWFDKKKINWSKRREKSVRQMLYKNLIPYLKNHLLSDITPVLLLTVIQKIEDRGAYYVANRSNQLASQIFNYGIQTGRCENNPAIPLAGSFKTNKTNHYSAIDESELPEFLDALSQNEARLFNTTRNAILFSLLTFCRPGEIRQARWEDIDFENRIWNIPAEYMKSKRDHKVPLSIQALEILEDQQVETAHLITPWVFPGKQNPNKPMSDGTVNVAIGKLGFKGRMTAHGFRALARTTIREKLNYYPDIIEAQLAHKPSGPLGAAYDRAEFIDERIKMMQEWGDLISNFSRSFNEY